MAALLHTAPRNASATSSTLIGANRAPARASGRNPPDKRRSRANLLVSESPSPKITDGRKRVHPREGGLARTRASASPLERRYLLGAALASAPTELMWSKRFTPAVRAAATTFPARSTCTDLNVARPCSFRVPIRFTTTSTPLKSRARTRGSCTSALIRRTVSSTRSGSLSPRVRVGTRIQWPSFARRMTSSVPTKPVPPRTHTVSSGWRVSKSPSRLLSESPQGDQDDRVGPPNLEHQHRRALCTLLELLHRGNFAAIRADDDIIVAQANLRGRASGLDAFDQRAAPIGSVDE